MPHLFLLPLPLTATLAGALFASLWQGTLLVLLVALGLRLLPGLTAAARSAIWASVLLLIALHPLWLLTGRVSAAAVPSRALHIKAGFGVLFVTAWALASLFRLFQLAVSGVELWLTLRSAQPLAATSAIAALLRQSPRRTQLCSSATVNRPCVAGFFHPRLLLPTDLLATLNEAELTQIVLHELEHLRRGDDWVNLLQQIALVLLPIHPALFWLNRRLALERELACDDAVLATTRAHKAYAACLAHVAEQSLLRRGLSLALSALGVLRRHSELSSRVERILHRPERTLSGISLHLATAVALTGTLVAGGALAHSPAWISFLPTAPPTLTAAETTPPFRPMMLPVRAAYTMGQPRTPHAMLLKAVLPSRLSSHKAQRSTAGDRLLPLARKIRLQRTYGATAGPRFTLAGWHTASSRKVDPAAPHSVPVFFAPRLVPVVVETQQVWYTAIRYGNGWIVVQL